MIIEILKYLSPAIILTLGYNIFQLFQKRKFEMNNFKRQETITSYKEFHSTINSIKNEYWKLFTSIGQTTILLKKKINKVNDTKIENRDSIKKIQLELSKFHSKSNKEIKLTRKLLEMIEREGFDKDEHEKTMDEHLQKAHEREDIGKNLTEKNQEILKQLNIQSTILKSPLELGDNSLFKSTKDISKRLQSLILDLNNIPLIASNIKNKPHLMIQNLTASTQKIINSIETEENINECNILDIIEFENIEESMHQLAKIEEHIYQVLK